MERRIFIFAYRMKELTTTTSDTYLGELDPKEYIIINAHV